MFLSAAQFQFLARKANCWLHGATKLMPSKKASFKCRLIPPVPVPVCCNLSPAAFSSSSAATSNSSSPSDSSSSSSSPLDYLRSFYLLVHPDKYSSLVADSPPPAVLSLLAHNSSSLARLNSIVDFCRALANAEEKPTPPFNSLQSIKFHYLPTKRHSNAESESESESGPAEKNSPARVPVVSVSDFVVVEELFDFSEFADNPVLLRVSLERSVYRLLLMANIAMQLKHETEWNEKWRAIENSYELNGRQNSSHSSDLSDPLFRSLSPEFRLRINKFPELRPQLENIRNLNLSLTDHLRHLQWSPDEEINVLMQSVIENSLIQFPSELSKFRRLELLNQLGRRLARPIGRLSIHAWIGVQFNFVLDAQLECTRTRWNLPIHMTDKEFDHFMEFWIAEFKLENLLIKEENIRKPADSLGSHNRTTQSDQLRIQSTLIRSSASQNEKIVRKKKSSK